MTNETDAKLLSETMSQLEEGLTPLVEAGLLSKKVKIKINNELVMFFNSLHALHPTDEKKYWQEFQNLFDFAHVRADKKIPMNAANLCPEPQRLLNAANILRAEYNRNVAQQERMGRGIRANQLRMTRAALAQGLGIPDSSLAIVRNASEGNNAISCGYRNWQPGDNVVLWKENHPTNLEAWKLRAEWLGKHMLFDIKIAEKLSDIPLLMDENTRFVSFSETSNGTGERVPNDVLAAIWKKAKTITNCHVHIDATMAWGAADCAREVIPYCHSFVSSAHKWFLGPKETGILYINHDIKPNKVEKLVPSIYAYDYQITVPEGGWKNMPKTAQRFEMIGQRDDVNIIALQWAQEMWNTLKARTDRDPHARVINLSNMLRGELLERGLWKEGDIITPGESGKSRGVFRVWADKGTRTQSLYDYMYDEKNHPDKTGIAGGFGIDTETKVQTFRLCPHIYNTEADITKAVFAMNAWKRLG